LVDEDGRIAAKGTVYRLAEVGRLFHQADELRERRRARLQEEPTTSTSPADAEREAQQTAAV
jgi:hypothetical protein